MANVGKLYEQLVDSRNNFKWSQVKRLLTSLGYTEIQGNGSRVKFVNKDLITNKIISLHKPHPGNEIGYGTAKYLIETLSDIGDNQND